MALDTPLDPLSKPANYAMNVATKAKESPTAPSLDYAAHLIHHPSSPSNEQHNQPNLNTTLQRPGLLFPWPATTELSHPSSSSFLVEANAGLSKFKSKQHDISETSDPEARKRLKSRFAQRKTRKYSSSILRMETYYLSGQFVGEKVKAGKEYPDWASESTLDTRYAYHATNPNKIDAVNDPEYASTLDQSSTKSQVSATSASSGRLGPLSSLTRAGMNAVIKVGACWRCRFLRKPVGAYSRKEINTDWCKCDPFSPCGLCPKGSKSSWEVVGCKRGSFKAAMLPITLCPKATTLAADSPFQLPGSSTSHETSCQPEVAADTFFRNTINRREMALVRLVQATEHSAEDNPILHDMEIRPLLQECLPGNCTPINQPGLAALNPLNECILAIAWELFDNPFTCFDITETGELHGLVRLLPSVARYQAKHQSESTSVRPFFRSLNSKLILIYRTS